MAMSMLASFFDIEKDSMIMFDGLKVAIWCTDWNTIYGYHYFNKNGFIWNNKSACTRNSYWSCIWIFYCSRNCSTGNLICACISFACFDAEEEENV